MSKENTTLDGISSDALREELVRRQLAANEALWERRKREAKYLCHECGMPNGWHTTTCCRSDTDCT